MKKVDLNVDIGEGFPHDEELLKFATSANICCGEHAGSWEMTLKTIDICKKHCVRIGCHPGFPDRESFGRRIPTRAELQNYKKNVDDQIRRFDQACAFAYIKPHGALYNILCSKTPTTDGIERGLQGEVAMLFVVSWMFDRAGHGMMLMPSSPLIKVFEDTNTSIIKEGFADRRYRRNGTLVSRSEANAVLDDPKAISRQVLRLAPRVDSICLHGDTTNCLTFAELVYKTLKDASYEVGY